MLIADFLRSDGGYIDNDWCDYRKIITRCCTKIALQPSAAGASFNYSSAKDVLKWEGISRRLYIHDVMRVGLLVGMPDKQWNTVKMNSDAFMLDGDAINKLAGG